MRSLGNSPVVDSTWQKRSEVTIARKSIISSVAVVFLLCIIYLDLNFSTIARFLDLNHWLWHVLEMGAACVLTLKMLLNVLTLVHFTWGYLFSQPVTITPHQRALLAVQQNEHGFRTPPQKPTMTSSATPDNSLLFTTSQASFSPASPDTSSPSLMHSFSGGFASPVSASPPQYQSPYSPSMSPLSGSFGLSRSSDQYQSLNSSAPSPMYDQRADTSLRSRHSFSTPRSASTSPYDHIKDQRTLHSYLQSQEDRELRSRQAQDSMNMSTSFWSYGSSALELTHTLRKYAYQLAANLPQSPAKTSATDHSSLSGADEVWAKYGVTEDDLYVWTEKLRKWLSATIVSRLSAQITEVNKQLQRLGCEDMQIGEMSVSTLKQLALTKGGLVPMLNTLLPYLDCFANQEYLVRRITDLGTGSMSLFTWNKGGNYGKPWAEHLITDASLVMQLLCTYLDSRLPAQPHYLDGKVFTAQHFIKTPDKPDTPRKDSLVIYQTAINPPHFQVVIGAQTYNLPKGRNNMFQAILLFFYHIKTREQGMLGRINLGLSGLNLLWIFD